jgi:hypothetical protein
MLVSPLKYDPVEEPEFLPKKEIGHLNFVT